MIRRPPRSTPFPTRRSSDLAGKCSFGPHKDSLRRSQSPQPDRLDKDCFGRQRSSRNNLRSEEHTSELQSQFHLVCRLLLEKKKKKKKKKINKQKMKKNRNK